MSKDNKQQGVRNVRKVNAQTFHHPIDRLEQIKTRARTYQQQRIAKSDRDEYVRITPLRRFVTAIYDSLVNLFFRKGTGVEGLDLRRKPAGIMKQRRGAGVHFLREIWPQIKCISTRDGKPV